MNLKCLLGLNLNLNVADFVQVGLGCLGGLVQMYGSGSIRETLIETVL